MIYDLSPPISDALAVWPGDTKPSREVLCDMADGANITLSTLHSTVHAGAHADGPNHYGAKAPSIDQRSLDYYLGPAQVVRVAAAPGTRVGVAAMPEVRSPLVAIRRSFIPVRLVIQSSLVSTTRSRSLLVMMTSGV